MPHTVETTVYHFDELSENAKEKARDWYREGNCEDGFWSEGVIEDAAQIAEILGIELKQRSYKTMGGKTRYEPCIWWSGFWSQGDGASYEGWYRPKKDAAQKIIEYTSDDKLQVIARDLEAICAEYPTVQSVRITQSGPYSHEFTMEFEAIYEEDGYELTGWADAENAFQEPLRKFARWIYRQLEQEYEYRQSDEVVDEEIRMNEYEFTEDGERF